MPIAPSNIASSSRIQIMSNLVSTLVRAYRLGLIRIAFGTGVRA